MGACAEGAGGKIPVPGRQSETKRQKHDLNKHKGQGPYSRRQHRAEHGKMGAA